MRVCTTILIFTMSVFCVSATAFNDTLSVAKIDSIYVAVDINAKKHIVHTVEAQETLYGISRKYGIPLMHIYKVNPSLRSGIVRVGDHINIPLTKNLSTISNGSRQKVFYRVKAKETLFRVARIYFAQSIDELRRLNHIEGNNLDIGQTLFVGYLTDSPSPTAITSEEIKEEDGSDLLEDLSDYSLDGQTWVEDQTLGYWHKEAPRVNGKYVMHRYAPLNSLVEVYNPMFNRTVHARVIGRIPEQTHTRDIDMIVSHGLAEDLGIIDQRFYVKVKYLR